MKGPITPEEQKVLIPFLRELSGQSPQEQAERAGLDPSTVRRYQQGKPMPRKSFEQLAAAARQPMALVEGCHLPAIRAGLAAARHGSGDRFSSFEAAAEGFDKTLSASHRAVMAQFLAEIEPEDDPDAGLSEEGKTWRFIEELCHESEEYAATDPICAVTLADLALRAAEREPGEGAQRSKLEGYVWAFLAHAHQAAGDPAAAQAAAARSRELWAAWNGPTPLPLDERRARRLAKAAGAPKTPERRAKPPRERVL